MDTYLTQGTLHCAGSTRRTSHCVSCLFFFFFRASMSVCDTTLPEIKAIEEKIFDEKRYSLETPLE